MATAVKNDTFEQEVIQSETPVLVDFWAEWCGPCHAVAPVLDRIVEEQAGALKLVKVNIDEERELAERFGIASIPTMILFRDGEPSVSVIGAQPKGAIDAEELRGVPERQQPTLDLLRRAEAEQEVAIGWLGAVLPAHHVRPHARERVPPRRSCSPTSRASFGPCSSSIFS